MLDNDSAPAAKEEVLDRVLSLLRRADLAMLATKEPPLRSLGVSGSLYAVLMNLRVTPGLTAAELARTVGVTPQAIGPLVTKLVGWAWIERRPHPRHASVQELHLTAGGRGAVEAADLVLVHLEDHLRHSLGQEEYHHLRSLLGRLIEVLPTWTPPDLPDRDGQ